MSDRDFGSIADQIGTRGASSSSDSSGSGETADFDPRPPSRVDRSPDDDRDQADPRSRSSSSRSRTGTETVRGDVSIGSAPTVERAAQLDQSDFDFTDTRSGAFATVERAAELDQSPVDRTTPRSGATRTVERAAQIDQSDFDFTGRTEPVDTPSGFVSGVDERVERSDEPGAVARGIDRVTDAFASSRPVAAAGISTLGTSFRTDSGLPIPGTERTLPGGRDFDRFRSGLEPTRQRIDTGIERGVDGVTPEPGSAPFDLADIPFTDPATTAVGATLGTETGQRGAQRGVTTGLQAFNPAAITQDAATFTEFGVRGTDRVVDADEEEMQEAFDVGVAAGETARDVGPAATSAAIASDPSRLFSAPAAAATIGTVGLAGPSAVAGAGRLGRRVAGDSAEASTATARRATRDLDDISVERADSGGSGWLEIDGEAVSARARAALGELDDPGDLATSRGTFGRPLASDVGETPLSTRFLAANDPLDLAPTQRVFGRPTAQTLDETPLSERAIAGFLRADDPGDLTTSRGTFGRPMRRDRQSDIPRSALEDSGTDLGGMLGRLDEPGDLATSRGTFGRPLASDIGETPLSTRFLEANDPLDAAPTQRVFGRPLASDVGETPLSTRLLDANEPGDLTTPGGVFGRPLASDVGETPLSTRFLEANDPLDAAPTQRVFGRPLAPDVDETPISTQFFDANEPGDLVTSRGTFGRPLASDVGETPLSTRALEADGPLDLGPIGRMFSRSDASSADGTPLSARLLDANEPGDLVTSRGTFGRPLASDIGETPPSARFLGANEPGDLTTSRGIFGRPLADDSGSFGFSGLSEVRGFQIDTGRRAGRRTIDVEDLEGPEPASGAPLFRNEPFEPDADAAGGAGSFGQIDTTVDLGGGQVARMRQQQRQVRRPMDRRTGRRPQRDAADPFALFTPFGDATGGLSTEDEITGIDAGPTLGTEPTDLGTATDPELGTGTGTGTATTGLLGAETVVGPTAGTGPVAGTEPVSIADIEGTTIAEPTLSGPMQRQPTARPRGRRRLPPFGFGPDGGADEFDGAEFGADDDTFDTGILSGSEAVEQIGADFDESDFRL